MKINIFADISKFSLLGDTLKQMEKPILSVAHRLEGVEDYLDGESCCLLSLQKSDHKKLLRECRFWNGFPLNQAGNITGQ